VNTHLPFTNFCSTNTGFNSMPTPEPNRGTTKVCLVSSPVDLVFVARELVAVSMGLLKVQRGRPRVGSQAELILVMAVREKVVSRGARRGREETAYFSTRLCECDVAR
jgi:hypothetical protein